MAVPEPYSNFGPGGIRWYGIAYLMGFLVAASLLKLAWKKGKSPYNQEQIMNLMTFQIVGVLLGGRVGYAILYSFEKFSTDPFIIFRVWEGGMSSHGGFLGVFIATLIYARISKQSPYPIGDLIVFIVPPGIFFGRIANFINGELWGRKTDLMWGVLFPKLRISLCKLLGTHLKSTLLYWKGYSPLFIFNIDFGSQKYCKNLGC